MTAVPRELLEIAVALRGAQPELWHRFLSGMRLYAGGVAADMMRCDPAMLPRAQGMAVQASEIANILSTAPEQLEKFKGQNPYGKPPGQR